MAAEIRNDGGEIADLRPGLILAAPEERPPLPAPREVRTDIACFLRVRRSAEGLEPREGEVIEQLFVKDLPGSPEGADCEYILRHRKLLEWREDAFAGEFRARHPSLARAFFDNGGAELHLLDIVFFVPSFDPKSLDPRENPEDVAEKREEVAYLKFYAWAMDRIEDYDGGAVSQVALPELWTTQVHLLPQVWALVAGYCKRAGNRFLVADSAPPLRVLQTEERRRAALEGVRLSAEELSPAALVPWFRAEKWARRDDAGTEVALTLDAVQATRDALRRHEGALSCIAVYWPWLKTLRGMDVPPCGAVAGVYARSDAENSPVGCMKPPANESVRSVTDLALHLDERPQNLLQRDGVNLLHSRPGKGVVVWGARTLSEDDLWRFVNVQRLIGYIGKQLEKDNQWAVFENNTPDLRERVRRDVRYFLGDLWERGALQGETEEQAFRVICDDENNPEVERERGILVVDVWVNPVQTNEFVHLQLTWGDAVQQAS
jgi:hypothetical protein